MSAEMSRLDSRRNRTATSNNHYRARLTEVIRLADRTPVTSTVSCRARALSAANTPGIATGGALLSVPVLELVVSSGGTSVGSKAGVVPWPCSTKVLKRSAEAVLLTDPKAELTPHRTLT
jgi:hypothetical protein